MSLLPVDILRHIYEECLYLSEASRTVSLHEFLNNETLKRAFVRSIEIIGEAVKNLPSDFPERYPNIDWRSMARMRDKLIHGYFGVDYEIVWDVVITEIPSLKSEIEQIIYNETGNPTTDDENNSNP